MSSCIYLSDLGIAAFKFSKTMDKAYNKSVTLFQLLKD